MKILLTHLKLMLGVIALIGLSQFALADSPLADTIKAGDRQTALAMVRAGANVNEPQNDGTTPLHWAVYQVDPELVATLLRNEADANVSNDFRGYAFIAGCQSRQHRDDRDVAGGWRRSEPGQQRRPDPTDAGGLDRCG